LHIFGLDYVVGLDNFVSERILGTEFLETTKHRLNPSSWVKIYGDTLYRFTCLRINDKEIARDLVQETFLAALRNSKTYKGEISEKNWLFTILKNKIIDHYRKKSSVLISEVEELCASTNQFFDENEHWKQEYVPKEWSVDYSTPVENKEFLEILNKCMDRLSELLKIVFTMKYLDEKESDEICKELAITTSNYWVILHRAKLNLRACLEKNWINK